MSWLAVDKLDREVIFTHKPIRHTRYVYEWCFSQGSSFPLPKVSIEKLIGRILTWEDEPVEFK